MEKKTELLEKIASLEEANQRLQQKIDELVAATTEGKAFVRPSGTEDILRLYAEARTVPEMEALAKTILGEIESKYKDF